MRHFKPSNFSVWVKKIEKAKYIGAQLKMMIAIGKGISYTLDFLQSTL